MKRYLLNVTLCAGTLAALASPFTINPAKSILKTNAIRDTRLQNAANWGNDATLMVGKKSDSVKKSTIIKVDFTSSGIPSNATYPLGEPISQA